MIKYESIFILDPSAAEEELNGLIKGFEDSITSAGGKVLKVDRWGKRRLAYRVGRHEDGIYTLLLVECPPDAARELERRYRMNDRIIKYLTVRIDKDIPEGPPAPVISSPGAERPAEMTETE